MISKTIVFCLNVMISTVCFAERAHVHCLDSQANVAFTGLVNILEHEISDTGVITVAGYQVIISDNAPNVVSESIEGYVSLSAQRELWRSETSCDEQELYVEIVAEVLMSCGPGSLIQLTGLSERNSLPEGTYGLCEYSN